MQTKTTVRLCTVQLKTCPREWDQLEKTSKLAVRHCAQCDRDVHFSDSDEDTIAKAKAGLCVARLEPVQEELDSLPNVTMYLGEPEVIEEPPILTPAQEAVGALAGRESGIAESLSRLGYKTTDCVHCGYPVPTFRKTCYVCSGAT